ncbi:MAG TPA: hypothetical protein VGC00_03725, partial [Thermoanaerobaculia bacterium]
MSLRQRLALGFLLFSALPLAGFALFSYSTARAALRAAARAEAEIAARDLERRVARASDEIEARIRTFGELPLTTWMSEVEGEPVGAGLVALTLVGFFPLTGSLVRDVRQLERGADAIAAGDLAARVEVRR